MLAGQPLHAFVASSDLARSRAFYSDTLGLTVLDVSDYAVELDAHGTLLRVTATGTFEPHRFTVLGWGVDDITSMCRELASHGVELLRFESMEQDDDGVWTAPSGAKVAWFNDPDGNVLSVSQYPQ